MSENKKCDQHSKWGYNFEGTMQNKIVQLLESHFGDHQISIRKNKFFRVENKNYNGFEVDLFTTIDSLKIIWEASVANSRDYKTTLKKRIGRIRAHEELKDAIVAIIVPDIFIEEARKKYRSADLIFSLRELRVFILNYLPQLVKREKFLRYTEEELRKVFDKKTNELKFYRWNSLYLISSPSYNHCDDKSGTSYMMLLDRFIDGIYEYKAMHVVFPTDEIHSVSRDKAYKWLCQQKLYKM